MESQTTTEKKQQIINLNEIIYIFVKMGNER